MARSGPKPGPPTRIVTARLRVSTLDRVRELAGDQSFTEVLQQALDAWVKNAERRADYAAAGRSPDARKPLRSVPR